MERNTKRNVTMNIVLILLLLFFTIIFFPYILAFIYAFGKLAIEVFESFAEAIKSFVEFTVYGWKVLIQEVFKKGGS